MAGYDSYSSGQTGSIGGTAGRTGVEHDRATSGRNSGRGSGTSGKGSTSKTNKSVVSIPAFSFDDFFSTLFGVQPKTSVPRSTVAPPAIDIPPAFNVPLAAPKNYITKYPELAKYTALASATAAKYGVKVDQSYFDSLIHVESRGKPKAKSKSSSAAGLYQFTTKTGKAYGLANLADRFNPTKSSIAVGHLTADNVKGLSRTLGRAPSQGETYIAHQEGLGSAKAIARNPSGSIGDVIGARAYQNNRFKGSSSTMSAKSFADHFGAMFGGRQLSSNVGGSVGDDAIVGTGDYDTMIGSAGVDSITTGSVAAKAPAANASAGGIIGNIGEAYDKILKGDVTGALTSIGKASATQGLDILNPFGAVADAVGIPGGNSDIVEGATGGLGDVVAEYFLRIVVILLGLIFVGVGLAMFKNVQTVVTSARQVVG